MARHRFDRSYADYPEDEANKVGLDLDDPALLHDITPVPLLTAKQAMDKFTSHPKRMAWIVDFFGEDYRNRQTGFNGWDWFVRADWDMLSAAFSTAELLAILDECVVTNEFTEELDYNPLYRVVEMVRSSLWRWSFHSGRVPVHYWYSRLKDFWFEIPGETDVKIRLDYATHHNEYGYSKYLRKFIDGKFAYLVYLRGEHVLTIGFSPAEPGLLLQQIHLTKKKGNRWLFKIPKLREYVIQQIAATFPGAPIFFTDGRRMADAVAADYRRAIERTRKSGRKLTADEETKMIVPEFALARAAAFYDAPLDGFDRMTGADAHYDRNNRDHIRLRSVRGLFPTHWVDDRYSRPAKAEAS